MIWFSLQCYHHFGLREIRQALSFSFFFFFFFGRGGIGRGHGRSGENGTVTGKVCPRGLYGIFCEVDFPSAYRVIFGLLFRYYGIINCILSNTEFKKNIACIIEYV